MDVRENSKELQQLQTFAKQEQYNIYPMNFNVLENTKGNTNRCNSVFFVPGEGYSDVPTHEEHSFENYSDSDSSSEVDGDASDDDSSLDEVLHDGKAKNKIELLASMVGVDTKEPAVVLTEVVRILKLLKRVNQYPININT
ncbi:hypothetical protein MtrunA17_Chr8g0390221 [Medicago truncatula]|uniref:Uncharacterized protein n=1 Tax=Medicago truncatula TaxID=3880 RepID=G7L861_MEDTR|nr:hypothetical protein MTR_8g102940 [Medicago truncatula]RHN43653.1 hypothetical protein MtrunA17_Chr8g0390221 [Medicago truncatula]